MATYTALYDADFSALDKQILVAIAVKANIIAKLPSPTAAQKAFAVPALGDPVHYLKTVRNYIIADYNTSTVAQIQGATDAAVQTAVNAAVDTLLGA